MKLPVSGARIGANPMTSISMESTCITSWCSNRSRTTARGTIMLAEPPRAATNRQIASHAMEGAQAQPAEASV